jgi:uncharacterized repeat protein (TIGR02543 family)
VKLYLLDYEIPLEDIKSYPKSDEKITLSNGQSLIASKMDFVLDNTDRTLYDDRYSGSLFYGAAWYNGEALFLDDDGNTLWKGRIKNLRVDDKSSSLTIESTNLIQDMATTPCVKSNTADKTPAELIYEILTDASYLNIPTASIDSTSFDAAHAVQDANSCYVNMEFTLAMNVNCLQVFSELCRVTQCSFYTANNIIYINQWEPWGGEIGNVVNHNDVVPGSYSHEYKDDLIFNKTSIVYINGASAARIAENDSESIGLYGARLFAFPEGEKTSTTITDYRIIFRNSTGADWVSGLALTRYGSMKKICSFEIVLESASGQLKLNDQIDLEFDEYAKEPARIIERNLDREKGTIKITAEFLNLPHEYYERDTTPPAPPEVIRAVLYGTTMKIWWSQNTEEDFLGYKVYFTVSPGEWESEFCNKGVSPIDVKNPDIEDGTCTLELRNFKEGAFYYIKIKSYDDSLNLSEDSNIYFVAACFQEASEYLNAYRVDGTIYSGLYVTLDNPHDGIAPDGFTRYLDDYYDSLAYSDLYGEYVSPIISSKNGIANLVFEASLVNYESVSVEWRAIYQDGRTKWQRQDNIFENNVISIGGHKKIQARIRFYTTDLSNDEWIRIAEIQPASAVATFNFYKVTFDCQGGNDVDPLYVVPGSEIAELEIPLKFYTGTTNPYYFAGWHKDSAYTEEWDYNFDRVSGNMTLYAKWEMPAYEVGDRGPGGGRIFYVNPNYLTDGWAYLEAACWEQSQDIREDNTHIWAYLIWGYGITSGDGEEIGDGLANTEMWELNIEYGGSDDPEGVGGYSAFRMCLAFRYEHHNINFDDWYLPSSGELVEIYDSLVDSDISSYPAQGFWSSTENTTTQATYVSFVDGSETIATKYDGSYTKARAIPIRQFKISDVLTVFFDSQVTIYYDPLPQKVIYGGVAEEPTIADPVGSYFAGWFTEPECINRWEFEYTVVADMTLYARWVTSRHTIMFDSNGGSAVSDVYVADGMSATEPSEPTYHGYIFEGWYSDEELTEEFDWNSRVYFDTTLYAKWSVAPSYNVYYDGNGYTSGDVPVDETDYYYGEDAECKCQGTMSKSPDFFVGWNTAANGSGTSFLPGESIPIFNVDVYLYAQWKTDLELGDIGPAGGEVFYVSDNPSGHGFRYLEARFDLLPTTGPDGFGKWSDNTSTNLGTQAAIGQGIANTALILASVGAGSYAVNYCDEFSVEYNGITYEDWFLPSQLELQKYVDYFWDRLIDTGGGYYSSTEGPSTPVDYSKNTAMMWVRPDNYFDVSIKTNVRRACPVRAIV